jgi:hypothetical protein
MNPNTHTAPGDDYQAASNAYFLRLELVNADGRRTTLPPPDRDSLTRHIDRYGTEGVDAIRDAYPIESLPLAAYRTTAPRGRRLSAEEIRVIVHFRDCGSPVSALAKTLNVSERRVRAILAAARAAADRQAGESASADRMNTGHFVPVRRRAGDRPHFAAGVDSAEKERKDAGRSRREGAKLAP